jgi:hypothetical protein
MDEQSASGPPEEFEAVQRRLAAFGTTPLNPAVDARVHARLRRTRASARPRVSRKLVLLAATLAFVLGSVGLAAADTLPAPAQEAAHDALAKVGLHVPPGHERYNDPVVCPGGPYKNHGAYVRAHKDDPDAGASPCGKPVKSVTHGDDATTEDDTHAGKGAGTGPPPWAHRHNRGSGKADKKHGPKNETHNAKTPDARTDDAQGPAASTPLSSSTTAAPHAVTTTVPDPTSTTTTTLLDPTSSTTTSVSS